MNSLMHPDTFYESNRQYQKKRLEESQRVRPFIRSRYVPSSVKDRFLLYSGELFIVLGKNLKSHAAQPMCKPQAA